MGAGPEHVQPPEPGQAQLLLVSNITIIVSILIININIQAKWEQDPNMYRLRNLGSTPSCVQHYHYSKYPNHVYFQRIIISLQPIMGEVS